MPVPKFGKLVRNYAHFYLFLYLKKLRLHLLQNNIHLIGLKFKKFYWIGVYQFSKSNETFLRSEEVK